jgi:hypothetical protein
MKKTDTQIQTPTKWRQTMPKNPMKPTEKFKRRHTTGTQWEFYRDDTGYGQPKCTGDTQEIPTKQK